MRRIMTDPRSTTASPCRPRADAFLPVTGLWYTATVGRTNGLPRRLPWPPRHLPLSAAQGHARRGWWGGTDAGCGALPAVCPSQGLHASRLVAACAADASRADQFDGERQRWHATTAASSPSVRTRPAGCGAPRLDTHDHHTRVRNWGPVAPTGWRSPACSGSEAMACAKKGWRAGVAIHLTHTAPCSQGGGGRGVQEAPSSSTGSTGGLEGWLRRHVNPGGNHALEMCSLSTKALVCGSSVT